MARNKKTNLKVKQVASKAKLSPKKTTPEPTVRQEPVAAVYVGGQAPNVIVSNDIEYAVESIETTRRNAIERAKKVDLRNEIKDIVQAFRTDIDKRLSSLSDRIENQLSPLVKTVTSIALTKRELETQLCDFESRLSAILNLNDELEPMDIENFFSPNPAMDDEMANYDVGPRDNAEDVELLAEVTDTVNIVSNDSLQDVLESPKTN